MKKICRHGHYYSGKRCTECHKTSARGYDHVWRNLSLRKRGENPLCEDCDAKGITTPAVHVHHIVPINEAPHLRLAWSNLVSLCIPCHDLRHGKTGD